MMKEKMYVQKKRKEIKEFFYFKEKEERKIID